MSAGFLGPCSGCASCGDGAGAGAPCDTFAFLYGAGRQAIGFGSYFPVSEGASQTYTVARLPHCFSYLGSPADYESATGSPPPVGEGGYYYDLTGSGQFYKNTGGVFGTSAPMPGYGRGEVTVRWTVQRTECGCPHMIPADTGTLTWSDGDVSDKTFSVAVTCPGPPTYWGCSESLAGGEVGNVVLSIVSLSEGACAVAGLAANLTAVCTHEAPHPVWAAFPYYFRKWVAGSGVPGTVADATAALPAVESAYPDGGVGTLPCSFGFTGIGLAGVYGVVCGGGLGPNSFVAYKSQIDARGSMNGSPRPTRVEVRLSTYEDFVLVSTGPWQDITDTTLSVPVPAMGGASVAVWVQAEMRTSYIGPACTVVTSPVFVCHPGLTCP